jgi:hypothetical protein
MQGLEKTKLRGLERLPLVGEVSDNFLLIEGVAWSVQRIPPAVNSVFLTGMQGLNEI